MTLLATKPVTLTIAVAVGVLLASQKMLMTETPSYAVAALDQSLPIDGRWDKAAWESVPAVPIAHYMGKKPAFEPSVVAKMQYDTASLYVIFRVQDRYVRSVTRAINGPVWKDACVEFFFAPDVAHPTRYFNLEVNAGGTPLLHYNTVAKKKVKPLAEEDIRKVEIAHSLPARVDPEIKDSVTWTVEYRIPLVLLRKYAEITSPTSGVVWRGNFYKIAENNSNPHYLTWAPVDRPAPDFHVPESFGELRFK